MTTQPQTTGNPYPTIADKVRLFKENGIAVFDCLDETQCDYTDYGLRICFDGDIAEAERAVSIARENGISILRLCLVRDFYDSGNTSRPYWLMTFLRQVPTPTRPIEEGLIGCHSTAAYRAHSRHWG